MRLTLLLCNMLRLKDNKVWLNKAYCYTRSVFDPGRRVYFWFCLTHLFKAIQNQLLASQQTGSKAFINKKENPISWALILKINLELKRTNISKSKKYCRVNDQVANPTSFRKMCVMLAKIAFEDNIIAYASQLASR